MLLCLWWRRRWPVMAMILTGGMVLQVTSCTLVAAEMAAGATSSIANELIRTLVSDYLGVGGGIGFF